MIRFVCLASLLSLAACSGANGPVTTAADTGTTGEDAAPVEDTAPWLNYPEGPYGLAVGETFPNLTFKGYRDGTGEWTDISTHDYYDPDGSRGINGIYWVVSAEWCPPCREEAELLPTMLDNHYRKRGAKIVTAMYQTSSRGPATQTTVDRWISSYGTNFDILLDTKPETLPRTGTVGLPYNYVINPRDMKVFKIVQGIDPTRTTIPDLGRMLTINGAPAT